LLPPLAAHAGFAAVFGVLGGFVALATLLTWRWLHEPAGDIAAPAPRAVGGSHAAAAQPLRDPTLRRLVLGIGLLCVPQFAILSFATVFLHDFAGFGAARIGIAMVTIQLGAMVSRVWSGRATDRLGNRRAFVRGTAGLAFALFAALAAATCAAGAARSTPSLDLAALLLVAAGIAVSAWHGVAYAELATMAGAQRAGTALGMANTVVYAGYFLTPLAIPSLLTRGGWGLVWLAAAGVVLVALPCFPRAAAR
ncbi:MFS transporter, partial [Burkholderia sp. Ac-20379]|uniref:MFS transporter n=1 Tax=Burkholderia sp. Ac-20379 TaxID=2703900 RepID=UPI0019823BB1